VEANTDIAQSRLKKCPAWNLVAGGDVSTQAFSACTFDLAQPRAIGREAAFKDQIQH
jgi:hypothetical protein